MDVSTPFGDDATVCAMFYGGHVAFTLSVNSDDYPPLRSGVTYAKVISIPGAPEPPRPRPGEPDEQRVLREWVQRRRTTDLTVAIQAEAHNNNVLVVILGWNRGFVLSRQRSVRYEPVQYVRSEFPEGDTRRACIHDARNGVKYSFQHTGDSCMMRREISTPAGVRRVHNRVRNVETRRDRAVVHVEGEAGHPFQFHFMIAGPFVAQLSLIHI